MFGTGTNTKRISKPMVVALSMVLSSKDGSKRVCDSVVRASSTADAHLNRGLRKQNMHNNAKQSAILYASAF